MDRKTKPPALYSQREELSVNLKNGKMMSKVLLYLLMITCMLTQVSSTEVKWKVLDTSPKLGQDLTLFCKVDNCTVHETKRWYGGPDNKPLMSDSGISTDKTKYNTSIEKNGFILTILNLTVKDLNVSYMCSCGFNLDKHILYIDVYKVDNLNISTNGINYVGTINVGRGVIIGYIAIPVILIIFLIAVIKRHWLWKKLKEKIYCPRRRNSDLDDNLHGSQLLQHPQESINRVTDEVDGQSVTDPLLQITPVDSNPRQSTGTNEEMEDLYNLNIEMENQQECIEVEIIQKGPIAVGYGGTIKINANIISSSKGSLQVNWQKTHNNCSTTLMINCFKYSGSSCDVNNPQLVINNVDKEDAGIYKVEVTSPTETKISPGILLELHGEEAEALSKEENNFFRLYFLTQKIATQAVQYFFDSKVPGHTLESFLKQHKSTLTSPESDYKCTKEQKLILFPDGHVVVVSANFDFTLLYKLIRNLVTTHPAPTRGWGKQPSSGDLNEGDDIERIRDSRNFLAHNTKLEICDVDFSTRWTDLSQAINRLSKCSLSIEVESMRTKKFDKCIKNEMEEDIRRELKQMRKDFIEIQNQVSDNKQNIADNKQNTADNTKDIANNKQNIADNKHDIANNKQDIADNKQKFHNFNTRHIPSNIKEGHVALISKWRKEDELFYDKTQGFTATLKMVKDKRYMTIIGGPGSGKTATARHIALQLEEQGWEVVPVCGLKDIINYGNKEHKQVFVLDDVLGIFALKMDHIINYQENILTAIGETSKLLFTCRKSVYNEAFKLGLFVTENVVDLQSKDNQLSETERMNIFQWHCTAKGVNPDRYTSLSFTNSIHMFPLLCKLFVMEEKNQLLGESFFNRPFKYFISELDKLLGSNTIQYAVLVLCLVNEGKLSVELLPHERKQVFNNCGVNLSTPDKLIIDAIYHMSETYFTKLDTEYTFTHDFIYEVIAYHYGRSQNGHQNQHHILKYLSSSYIANKVTVYEQASTEDHCIQISKDMYLSLAERLYTDIKSMNLFDVFMNKSLKHGPFRDVFEGMLKRKPFDEFESLILMKHENIRHFAQKALSVNKHIQAQSDITKLLRLHLLFDEVLDVKFSIEYNVRVISWIINYGHTHLLQEIINHVECNNHSISLIFGSNVMENMRLLLLGCFSNNLGMVELILKYVDPKCIDMDYGGSSNIERNFHRWDTPLTAACATGNLCIVKALLSNKAGVNKCNYIKQSPLCVAVERKHVDVVRCLLSSGADANMCDRCGHSPLFTASQLGLCDIVKYLVTHSAYVNLCDVDGQSPLFIASQSGHCDIVKDLVAQNADVNLCDSSRKSPLSIASEKGHCDIVKYLVAHNADVNLTDESNRSPLYSVAQMGHYDIVLFLLQNGADVNIPDLNNKTPLHVASSSGHYNIVRLLGL